MSRVKVSEKPYKFLKANRDKRFIYLYGGASSSKSHTMAQYIALEILAKMNNVGILIVRKTRPAVRASCWKLLNYWLDKAEIPHENNKTTMTINVGSNFAVFDGVDNIFKKKSMEGINYVWVEEAAGIYHDAIIVKREFLHLDIVCRNQNENGINQIFCTFNPVDPIGNAWLVERTESRDSSTAKSAVLGLTHKDNPFLSPAERESIENLANEDEEYDKIYRQGIWATPTNLIYTNWDAVDEMPEKYDERCWGLDFGYSSNPVALIEVRFCGNEIYEKEWLYRTGLTNPQLIEKMGDIITNRNEIVVADCAEPKSITEIKNAGFNIFACKKGADSVRHGINTVKRFRVHILRGSNNLLKEKQGYKWKVDRDENPLPEPLKFKDHLMDAERYIIQYIKGKVKAGIYVPDADIGKPDKSGDDYDPIDDDEIWEAA